MLYGYFISVGLGVMFGLMMGVSRPFGKAVEPLITAFYSFPHGTLIPIMILLFGIGLVTRTVIVVLYTFFAIVINTYSGVINTGNEFRDLGRAFNLKRTEVWRRIILPGASAFILTGLRVSFGYAIRGAVMAELLIGAVGLGGMVLFYTGFWRLDVVFAVILVLMAIGLSSNYALRYVERKLCPWRREYGEGQ
jgi:ABC-type nitrate/sulfonate/bicarbonate transport system permease component